VAYARWGSDSDVYLWPGGLGYECSLCYLQPHRRVWSGETPEEALAHLKEHLAAGHKVPVYAVRELEEECEED
jgi:hypothetical protein